MHMPPLARFSFILFAAVLGISAVVRADGPEASPEKEAELLAVLRSDAPGGEKAIACKLLAIHGSSAAVPDLARLLPDAQLASWARIALEVIPGSAADEALRKATDSLSGKLLVGTINSIGFRRDANAVESLVSRLQDEDPEVASAAAVALGRIGNSAAEKALRKALADAPPKVRSAVAEGCVLCAERRISEDRTDDAARLYDEVRKADVPRQRILEATRGAILVRKEKGISLLIEQIRSPDKGLFQIALSTAREFPGREIDQTLATEMARATPERAALLIEAMADRKETVVLAAVLKASGTGPKAVRLAAIGAVGRVGDITCLPSLLATALDEDEDLAQAAVTALAVLPDAKVDAEIVTRLNKATGEMYLLLVEVVGQRRIQAVEALLKAVAHSDKAVRGAALIALGETVPPERLSVLITQVVAPKFADDAPVALQALRTASIRMPDRERCASELAMAFARSSSVATKSTLLEVLGAVGGAKSLETIVIAAKSADPKLLDTSTRLLGEWTSADAAPALLDLAKTAAGEKFQVRALSGYIRIANKFVMPEGERTEMCKIALEAAKQPADQKKVLDVLKKYPNLDNLKLAAKVTEVPEVKDEATQVALFIGQKVGGKSPEARAILSKIGMSKVKLEIIKAEYGAGGTQKDVTELIQKQATDLPLINLPAAGYNASFGGDPAPGTVKQLKVQYKMNGKPGEASFAEDALIILPMPK